MRHLLEQRILEPCHIDEFGKFEINLFFESGVLKVGLAFEYRGTKIGRVLESCAEKHGEIRKNDPIEPCFSDEDTSRKTDERDPTAIAEDERRFEPDREHDPREQDLPRVRFGFPYLMTQIPEKTLVIIQSPGCLGRGLAGFVGHRKMKPAVTFAIDIEQFTFMRERTLDRATRCLRLVPETTSHGLVPSRKLGNSVSRTLQPAK